MSKILIFRNKCFFSTYLSYSGSYYTYELRYELQLHFFNSEFNEKQQVNQLSEHVAVKKNFILFLCKLEFLQIYFETTDNIYPLYVSKF